MTNTFSQGLPEAPSSTQYSVPSARMPPRHSSYASVAAGTANTSPHAQPPPVSAGAFSYFPFQNHTSSRPGQNQEQDQRPNMAQQSADTTASSNGVSHIPNSWGKGTGSLPIYSQYSLGGGHGFGNTSGSGKYGFFRPTYLRESKYMQRLEIAHKAKLATQKEVTASMKNPNSGLLTSNSSSVSLPRMIPSHRGMTHDIVENPPPAEDDSVPPLPSKWAEVDRFGGLEIGADGLDVRYTGLGKTHEHEAAAARTDHSMPPQCGIYYYEATILQKGKDGMIGIGFSGHKASLEKLPGWEPESWGFHGDDGKSYCCQSAGKPYGPTFGTGDIVGCGVNFMTGCAFFTKNGIFQGNAFRDLKDVKLYPSVGMRRPGAHLRVNFGAMPFMYDIDGMMSRERSDVREDINLANVSTLHPPLSENALIKELVAQFLRHDGFVGTAKAFSHEIRAESTALDNGKDGLLDDTDIQEDLDAINRQNIRAAILEGDIDKALKRTNAYYPYVLRDNPRIYFRLRCRKFVEMMRQSTELLNITQERRPRHTNGHTDDVFGQAMDIDDQVSGGDEWDQMDTEEIDNGAKYQNRLNEALQYAQELQFEFKHDQSSEVKDTLAEVFALFAYEDPQGTPTAPLLDLTGRVPVAEELNSAILVSLGKSSSAALERLCQQTEVLLSEISEQGGAGAFVNIEKDFLR